MKKTNKFPSVTAGEALEYLNDEAIEDDLPLMVKIDNVEFMIQSIRRYQSHIRLVVE